MRTRAGTSGSRPRSLTPSSRYRPMNRKSLPRCTKNRRHRASGRSSSSGSLDSSGSRLQQLVLRPAAHDPADGDRDGHAEQEPTGHHRPERRPAAERHVRRGDHDRVQHRCGEHERDGRRRHQPALHQPSSDGHRAAFADREREAGERGRAAAAAGAGAVRASRTCRSARRPRPAPRRARR